MTGPKEDRFRLLKATGVNLSPVVLLARSAGAGARALLDRLTAREPDAHRDDRRRRRAPAVDRARVERDEDGTARPGDVAPSCWPAWAPRR